MSSLFPVMYQWRSFYLVLPILLLITAAQSTSVAIIGGGIGGSSSAYFLRHDTNTELQVSAIVFEKDEIVGGRLQHFVVDDDADPLTEDAVVELGGSIWHESNKLVHGFALQFNISIRAMANSSEEGDHGTLGIWNGGEFVFRTSKWRLVSLAKLFWRYGLSPLKLKSATNSILDSWMSIYDQLVNQSLSFTTVPQLLESIQLSNLTTMTLSEHLIEKGCSKSFVDELITGITRVQYGQDAAAMHALVGLVSLVGAEEEKLYGAKDGNRQICESLLKSSGADVRLKTRATRIERESETTDEGYVVVDCNGKRTHVDAVIIATPLEFANITIDFIEQPAARPYQTTIATLIRASAVNGSYFGLSPNDVPPTEILTTENSSLPFSSLAVKEDLRDGSSVYKIFSRKELPEEFLDLVFVNRTWTHTRNWKAYPVMHTPPQHAPFSLAKDICYVNAFETAISAMETEALAAKNCVNLIKKSLLAKRRSCTDESCSD